MSWSDVTAAADAVAPEVLGELGRSLEVSQRLQAVSVDVRPPSPTLLLLSGLPGSGTTFLARKLAGTSTLIHIRSDVVRRRLYPIRRYTQDENHIVHSVCREIANRALHAGKSVVIDSTNLIDEYRAAYQDIASRNSARFGVAVINCPDNVARARLRRRTSAEADDGSDAGEAVYEMMLSTFVAVRNPSLEVSGAGDVEAAVDAISRWLGKPSIGN